MSSVALSERLRKLKSELKRSGAPMESIDIALLTAILGGLPHTKKQLHQLEHGLRVAFEKAGLRIRSEGVGNGIESAHAHPPLAKVGNVPLMDEDEDDRTVLDSRLDSTGTIVYSEKFEFVRYDSRNPEPFFDVVEEYKESLVVRRRVARDRQLEAILRLRASNPEEFRRRHFEMMAIETQEGE
ncbi:hypothetical protein PF010_g30069 [Phytophthora fragariae]|uniref:Uncharacterized protein n=1 Tax=Phytophthora fragariae TaxID=53985 RepID=A0A6G0JLS6_9STRA|nr:hypothetical protein PF010_g30069 [Phytophthora fragariae]